MKSQSVDETFDKVQIEDATARQMADFCRYVLNIPDCPYQLGKDKLRAKMEPLWPQDYILVFKEVEPVQAVGPQPSDSRPVLPPLGADEQRSGDFVIVNISEDPLLPNDRVVPVAVNGRLMLLPRNKNICIPVEYKEILDNAQQLLPIQDDNGKITGWREVGKYPHSVVRGPAPEAELAHLAQH